MAHRDGQEYDIIFAGGGTAACVAAGRLAVADPKLSILVIELGKNNLNDPSIEHPVLFPQHLTPEAQTVIMYKSNASPKVNDREVVIPSGGVLGGGSSINFMAYTRPQRTDFDNWGIKGWDYDSLLPYMKKLETFHLKGPGVNEDVHGYDGPVHISLGGYPNAGTADEILEAAQAIGKPTYADLQDFESCDGFSRMMTYTTPEGKRQDAATCYVQPLIASGRYPNLHFQLETVVSRVLFDDQKRAVGVEYEPNQAFQPVLNLSKRVTTTVRARKLVVLTAGALGTPPILERSGIGGSKLLSEHNIDLISDLPGVGENYQDHSTLFHVYKTTLREEQTADCLFDGRVDLETAMKENNPMLGWSLIGVVSKIRPDDQEVEAMGPEFKTKWDQNMKSDKSRPLMFTGFLNAFVGDHSVIKPDEDGTQFITCGMWNSYPYSRGNVHIKGTDAQQPASFNCGFLNDDTDLESFVWAYKKAREVARRTSFYNGELALVHPKFPPGSKAAPTDGPAKTGGYKTLEERKSLPAIEYSAEDDAAIREYVRANIGTTWHSSCTAKMGAREDMGVVDPELNVYGVTGLKIADLSVLPELVGANSNNTALMLGEKAADIIATELGLKV